MTHEKHWHFEKNSYELIMIRQTNSAGLFVLVVWKREKFPNVKFEI